MGNFRSKPKLSKNARPTATGSKRGSQTVGVQSESALPMPPSEKLGEMFEQFVKELGLRDEKLRLMMSMDDGKKWLMLQQQMTNEQLKTASAENPEKMEKKSAKECAKLLINASITPSFCKFLVNLEVSLRTEPISWVKEFINEGGSESALNLTSKICLKQLLNAEERETQHNLIRILKAVMNNPIGLSSILKRADGISILTLCLDCDSLKIKPIVLQLLAAVCFVPTSFKLVLDAMDYYTRVKKERFRFQSIIADLSRDDSEYNVSAMIFLNAIVSASEDPQIRFNIREEVLAVGLSEYLTKFKTVRDEILLTQVDYFEDESKLDQMTMFGAESQFTGIDINDPKAISDAVITLMRTDAESTKWFNLVMKQMLMVPQDARRRAKYMQLFYLLIKEIMVQGHGSIIDVSKFTMNMDAVLEELFTKDNNEESQKISKELEKQITQQLKTINQLQDNMVSKDSIIKKYEEEVGALRLEVSSLGRELSAALEKRKEFTSTERLDMIKRISSIDALSPASPKPTRPVPSPPPVSKSSVSAEQLNDNIPAAPPAPPGPINLPPPPPPPPGPPGAPGLPPPPPPPGPPGAPPPPGSMPSLSRSLPAKKKIVPNSKMRQLQWNKVPPSNVEKTIWNSISNEEAVRSKIDLTEFEEIFSQSKPTRDLSQKNILPSMGSENDLGSNGSLKPKIISVIDSKRAYNLSIMLSRVKPKFSELREAILDLKDDIMTEQMIKQFLNFVPTTEEAELLAEHETNYELLGKPEQFFVEMLKIDRYEQRLKSMLYRKKFTERFDEIYPSVTAVLSTSRALLKSKRLKSIFEIILALGNYMNGDSFRGGAYGFSLDTLGKLNDTKTSNNKSTLMHYFASILEKHYSDCLKISEDVPKLEQACRVNISVVLQEFQELSKGMEDIKRELALYDDSHKPDRFHAVMKPFVEINEAQLLELAKLKTEMEERFSEAVTFMNEDPKSTTAESFFSIFLNFISNLDKARKDLAREADLLKRQEKQKQVQKPVETPVMDSATKAALEEKRGVMDDLISSLKTGDAFKAKSKKRRATAGKNELEKLESPDPLDALLILASVQQDEAGQQQ